jgi:hypothetical protein
MMKRPLTLFQRRSPSVGVDGPHSAQFVLALLAAWGLAAPALPQDVTAPCSTPAPPLSIKSRQRRSSSMSRSISTSTGWCWPAAGWQRELGPDGVRNVSGSITAIGARAMVGEVVIRGANRYVRIELPRRIELQGFSGGVIRLESLRSDLPQMPQLDGNGRLKFRVGGVCT